MNIKKILSVILLQLPIAILLAQSYYQLPGTRTEHISDRWYVLGYDQSRMSSIRNIDRRDMMLGVQYLPDNITSVDQKDKQFIVQNNTEYWPKNSEGRSEVTIENEKVYVDSTGTFYYYNKGDVSEEDLEAKKDNNGVFGLFYNNRANFYEVNTKNFTLRANPIINIQFGRDGDRTIVRNTRGAELRGTIDNKIYYYTLIHDNQRNFAGYIESTIDKFKAVPGHGTYKDFESSVLDDFVGYDYFDAQGYVGLDVSGHVALELGHGKHMIGNGIRSLLLSDSGDNYFYVKLNTRIWKLQYQNIWAELNSLSFRTLSGDRLLTKKYMATHYLSYKPTKKFEIGLFETVIFERENQYELQYLNPIILYRVIESGLGSPDNVILGMNANYTFGGHFQAYGQFVLDEFKLDELKAGSGWWANKFGYQLGLKYYNALSVDHLDLQIEYNTVRPYTYSHSRELSVLPEFSNANYTHHSQPLAHPLGANFKEILASAKYQWRDKFYFQGRAMITAYGEDGEDDNLGNNILLVTNSSTVNMPLGNETGQGLQTDIMMLSLNTSYQFMYNYYLDLDFIYRKSDSQLASKTIDTKYIGLGLRVNMGRENIDY